MKKINNIHNDSLKLTPDKSIRFNMKDSLKRSAELDFESSEYEYKCIEEAEDNKFHTENTLAQEYSKLRLKPDMNIVMPDKHLLKYNTHKRRNIVVLITSSVAVAAIVMIFLMLQPKKETTDVPTIVQKTENVEENTIDKTEKRQNTQVAVEVKIPEKKQPVLVEEIKEIENKGMEIPRRDIKIQKIDPIAVSIEDNSERELRPVLAYTIAKEENVPVVNNTIAFINNVNEKRYHLAETIENFRLGNLLGKDSKTDKYISEWIKNNKDIPFEIHANQSEESKITEIYDQDGNLVKALFFTRKPVRLKINPGNN